MIHKGIFSKKPGDFQEPTSLMIFSGGILTARNPHGGFLGGFVQPPTSLMFASMSKSFKRIIGCKVGFKGDIVGYKQHLLELGVFQASGPPNNRDTSDCLGLRGPYFEANPYG